jgi:L,D-transpeptidase ErfK/SrfK
MQAGHRSGLRTLATLMLCAAATGCSLLRPAPAPPPRPVAAPPTPAPVGAEPHATHRFEFDAREDDVVGQVEVTIAAADDTLPDIARRFNVGYEEIVRANPGVDPWLPGVGREIVLPTQFVLPDAPRTGVVINVAAMRLYYFPPRAKGQRAVVITHPIGIGKVGWSTPEGVTRIVARVKDPTWIPPESVRKEHREDGDELPARVPAGPDNPLGAYMFRLAWPTYLIHGTNKPYGVGMRSSHGCVRLYPEDIELLYESIPIGTPVRVVNQPLVLGWQGATLYAQAFGPLDGDRPATHALRPTRAKIDKQQSRLALRLRERDANIDWEAAQELAHEPTGVPVPVMRGAPSSPAGVIAAAERVRNTLPTGATWNGRMESSDEQQYREVLGAREAPVPTASANGGARP